MGFSSASAAEMGLSKTEYEDAVNLEKLYFLANNHDRCASCSRGGVCAVDMQRYEFLCGGCSSGKAGAKRIGSDRFSTFEVQKLLNKFGGNSSSSTRDSGGGTSSHLYRRSSSSAKAFDRRRRHGRGHSRRRDSPSPSSESPVSSDDSPPSVSWAASKSRGSRAEKSSSRRRAGGAQEDFSSATWPQVAPNPWTGATDAAALPGMGGLAGMGLTAAAASGQSQPTNMWMPTSTPQGLIPPGMQHIQMPPQQGGGAPMGSYGGELSQQQWRNAGTGLQLQQVMPQQSMLQQHQMQASNQLFGMQPPQQALGMGSGAVLGRPPQMMLQQQTQPNSMLQPIRPPQQQRNPFASMRGPQQAAVARPSNPFASMQGPLYGSSPFQQQPQHQQLQQPQQQPQLQQPQQQPQLQQPQLQQQQNFGGMQQVYRTPGTQQAHSTGAPLGPSFAATNPFASTTQSGGWAGAGGAPPFTANAFNSSIW
ncbi:RNA polymerase II degradation factor 1 [Cyclospora cayetanensis]|uniref:RNA polymerase II degradation factor 1 n=1 Tax=Cyclospora cayetanensis TaxID=88456 RepID=A0A6P6RWL7_9EIME|nr:RNA polymerase II degradation factor 1 [Cyclospora cayetanensis]